MGMIGKDSEPSQQWVLLRVLAQLNGELTIKDTEAKDKYKKHKQGLAQTLKHYFSIDYDPFYPYHSTHEKGGNSYKIKLTLIPPPSKDKPRAAIISDKEADSLGIDEYLKEVAPQL